MSARHLVVESNGLTGVVKLDGVELQDSLRGLSITWGADGLPVVVLDPLVVNANVLHSGYLDVRVPDATQKALVSLGWTPPPDGA